VQSHKIALSIFLVIKAHLLKMEFLKLKYMSRRKVLILNYLGFMTLI